MAALQWKDCCEDNTVRMFFALSVGTLYNHDDSESVCVYETVWYLLLTDNTIEADRVHTVADDRCMMIEANLAIPRAIVKSDYFVYEFGDCSHGSGNNSHTTDPHYCCCCY